MDVIAFYDNEFRTNFYLLGLGVRNSKKSKLVGCCILLFFLAARSIVFADSKVFQMVGRVVS